MNFNMEFLENMDLSKYPAPEVSFDDLGIFHEVEVPMPGKYKRQACKCGIIHRWENPETFELFDIEMIQGGDKMGFPRKVLKRCRTCNETLLIRLVDE